MTLRRREYHVDCRAKKAATFFVACEPNTATRVKSPNAMRIRGYSQSEAADQALQMQVHREAEKIKGEAIPGPPAPEAAAMSALLSPLTTANVGRVALAAITPVPAAGPILPAAGVATLPTPPRKMQKRHIRSRLRGRMSGSAGPSRDRHMRVLLLAAPNGCNG